jgi:putative CocE/NonD family hydrolase
MGVFRGALERLLGLPAATSAARRERDLRVPMRDGVELLADRWFPASGSGPLLLVRSPYGRASMFGFLYGRCYAERGFQVVIQSCRGTYGSGGDFEPMAHEAADAVDTVAWLRDQPWFDGRLATLGASYLCFTQWALAESAPPELRAMVASVGPHEFGPAIRPGGALALDTAIGFAAQVTGGGGTLWKMASQTWKQPGFRRAFRELPLGESYQRALGTRVGWFEDWLAHDSPVDPYWSRMDHSKALDALDAPVLLQGGWYDMFAADTIGEYERLRDRGMRPHLTMGAWSHRDFGMHAWVSLMPEVLAWLRTHVSDEAPVGDDAVREHPVRVFVLGADEWREYDDWPPPGLVEHTWYLAREGRLVPSPSTVAGLDEYRYDPADPTPAVGGPLLFLGAGPKDNGSLEGRADVLTYTSERLEDDVTIFGAPRVEVHLQSSAASTDVFARLCDVDPSGRSTNVCDGLVRVERVRDASIAEALPVRVTLSPTACRIERNHRIRLQVSSGAHPRFARNPGTGDPTATADRLVPAEQRVHHGPERRSCLRFAAS